LHCEYRIDRNSLKQRQHNNSRNIRVSHLIGNISYNQLQHSCRANITATLPPQTVTPYVYNSLGTKQVLLNLEHYLLRSRLRKQSDVTDLHRVQIVKFIHVTHASICVHVYTTLKRASRVVACAPCGGATGVAAGFYLRGGGACQINWGTNRPNSLRGFAAGRLASGYELAIAPGAGEQLLHPRMLVCA
jgi:hypothetical protein